jgi:hypothetical protein
MAWLRREVRDLPTNDPVHHGGNRRSENQLGNTKLKTENDATYTLRRLKRDRPDVLTPRLNCG